MCKIHFFQYTILGMTLIFPDLNWQMPECILAPLLKGLLMICS
jgi:hypothetical protein